ncbi:MAG: response regulator transcription factor [Bacillota bacterium]
MYKEKRCILIVDDAVKMVRVLKDTFKMKGFHVLEAYNGQEALDVYYENNQIIDLILLDVMMPVCNGLEVLQELRENQCTTPVIMLTAKGEEYDQLEGFKKGADDYIVKPFSSAVLLARIESVLKRTGKSVDSELKIGLFLLQSVQRKVFLSEEELDLTKREFDLLQYFMVNHDITFTREQLLDAVWGYDFDGDIRTVDTHIKQLRLKLGSESECIKTVYRVGYKFEVVDV